jgi:hypothetical protein
MSMYNIVPSDYFEGPAGTPGWADAPVPGWGINPFRAGPVRVGVDGLGSVLGATLGVLGDAYQSGSVIWNDAVLPRYAPIDGLGTDQYKETSWGMTALVSAGSIGLGLLFGYAWWGAQKSARSVTPNRRRHMRRNATYYGLVGSKTGRAERKARLIKKGQRMSTARRLAKIKKARQADRQHGARGPHVKYRFISRVGGRLRLSSPMTKAEYLASHKRKAAKR